MCKDINYVHHTNAPLKLLTPEATPVSTPVITATIRQPISPRGLASVSRTLADGSGSSGDGEGRKRMSRLSALILPGSIVSDLEQQQQQSSGSSSSSGGRRNDPLLQDTVSHFSSYCMNFPALLSSNNPTAATPTSISATPPSSPRTTTTTGRPATMPASTTTMMTGSAAPTTSGKKSKNPFLAMFGKSTTHTPSPLSPLQGPVSTSGSEGHAHLSSTGGKEAVPVPRKGKKASGDEDAGSKKRTSWFKPSTQRRRANTMVALPVSGPGESLNEGGVGSLRSIHRGSTFSTPSSSATSATVTASGPESSAPRASTTTTTAAGPLASRRFSASFHFNLRGGSQRPTLSTANNSNSSSSQSLSSGQHSPVSPSFPRSVQAQSTGSQQGRQYSYSSGQGHQHLGPSTTTATGSFFDSVSDDSDSDDDLPYQCQRQYQRQYQQQYQSQPPLTPQYQSARRPANHPTSQYYAQQQEEEAATARQQERRYHVYDSEDSETDEDEESSDDDSDEVEDDDEEERRHSSRQYQHQQQQRRQVNPDTLEGYEHRFEDAPPPPSYHSLIQSDATHAAAVATTSTTTSTDAYTYPHTTTIMLTGLSSSSSSSSTIITPTTATTSSPSSRHTVSAPILNQLLQLLHHFESHLLDNFKTPSFQPSTATSTTGTTTNDTATSNRRQAWLDRNPKTVASFAYLLIELQQTGILPTAMSPAWSSSPSLTPPTSSSSSTTVSRPLFEMSEQDWLSMTGNASTEADLAKAMVALEQNCHHGLDPARWRRQQPQSVSVRDAWVHQVQTIYVATTTTTSSA
ncbi:hypothetical protein BGX23_012650 [Mortierella sp. AD031]|nr:hypothetical protein BGX23_012650 [Mortierella sp. AD031]